MSPLRLAFRSLTGHAFRSLGVFMSALLVAGFALGTSLIVRGAEDSLQLAVERLGADIIVVPEGGAGKVESAILLGRPVKAGMPRDVLERVAAVPGVAAASPQRYLVTVPGQACCGVDELSLVAFDPATDFTLQPWMEGAAPVALQPGEVIAGAGLTLPGDKAEIELYGLPLQIKSRLASTGTHLDHSLFMNFDTAGELAGRLSAEDTTTYSAILVRLQPGAETMLVSLEIMRAAPQVTPVQNLELFASYRRQLRGLLVSLLVLTGLSLGLSLALVVLVFTLAANERRRELGVLRVLGANRGFVFRALLFEAVFLALAGGLTGSGLAVLVLYLFRSGLVRSLGLPFLMPSASALLAQVLVGAGVALVSITLAAILPALRISRMEPAMAMRE